MQQRAAYEFSCPDGDVSVESIGGTTYKAFGCGQSATYTCSSTYASGDMPCVRDEPSSSAPTPITVVEAPRAAPASQLRDPPDGAGGFRFGVTEGEARQACEQSGHIYRKASAELGICDGLPMGLGVPAKGRLRFCAEKLCAVSLELEPDPKETLVQTVIRFKTALAEKYGQPTTSQSHIPNDCSSELAACVAQERAKIRFEWQWPSRHGIVAWAAKQPEDPMQVKVHIYYSSPAIWQTKSRGL